MRWLEDMLQIWPEDGLVWPVELRPHGEGTYEKEPVEGWYDRNSDRVGHLHPLIAGQWVYRHWDLSPYCSLPLAGLAWTEETWTSEEVLGVHCPFWEFNAEHDYQVFNTFPDNPTATPMNATGTWDIPIVLLQTPAGLIDAQGPKPGIRHLLIEGHSRMRDLNSLVHRGEAASSHRVFVLRHGSIESPQN
ncbi:hypothetical protein GCM10008171_29250 [Methylopila jiangsuensis]|uniref:Uncharacterized protein n=1 Tax=Methylopila jiangsuensis TaxID=586230 RepID=A0A9W6JHE2_9HYPH|nr:hypothetical protein [Methylopila jiangsuensis]MDR6284941.1 hypothetical protein [Methylopila jiangsuensis]GLK77671.1 hypothetical protein GCM10008171_29250 [Methylopila jiangsuensis]